MNTPDTALSRRRGMPKLVFASSLDQAPLGATLYVDQRGRVRSPVLFRLWQAVEYMSMGVALTLPVLYGVMLGPAGVVGGGALAGFISLRFRNLRRLRSAAALMAQDREDEAEVLLQDLLRARFMNRPNRALARYNLAVCTAGRGDHAAALELVRQARGEAARLSRLRLFRAAMAYQEIRLLVELGRADEARLLLDEMGEAPQGEYLRVAHWTTELYVCLAENGCPLDDEALHERARKGLAMTSGSILLGLCGWAFAARGDDDMATHLVTEAFDRMEAERLRRKAPRLHQWMSSYGAAHGCFPEALPD